jgi:hypothetical protein
MRHRREKGSAAIHRAEPFSSPHHHHDLLRSQRLLHRHALGQVPRLVHVAAAQHGDVVRQQLQRHAR